jgi:hypothetical protein
MKHHLSVLHRGAWYPLFRYVVAVVALSYDAG